MTRQLSVHWWSPRRDPGTLAREVRHHSAAWIRIRGGTPLTNFGDELSRILVERATGRRVRWAPIRDAALVGLGSLLIPYVRERSWAAIWGSGLNRALETHESIDAARIIAVRGPLTAGSIGVTDPVLGDPAVLVPELLGPTRPPRRSGLLLIPHFTAFATRERRRRLEALRALGMSVAMPTLAPEEMIRRIVSADLVVSSGMHGMILANTLGTPVRLVSLADAEAPEADFKYRDYAASVGEPIVPLPWRSLVDDPSALARQHELADAVRDRLVDATRALALGLQPTLETIKAL